MSDTPGEPQGSDGQGGAERTPSAARLRPFAVLVRTHALFIAGDASVAIALAGSLFFSIDPSQARWRVALYLLFTVAPFAVVAPFLGPAVDRIKGGRRMMIVLIGCGRVLVSLLMAGSLDSLLLFPMAFAALVLGKAYAVAKSALVPSVVRHEEELVEANAKLGSVAGLTGFVAAIPAVLLSLIGAPATVLLSAVFFALAAVSALQLPRTVVAANRATADERVELHSTSITLGATAMTLLRGTAGFLTFLIAFWLRDQGASTAFFGVVLSASAIGTLIGNVTGPAVRRQLREQLMLLAALVFTAVAGIMTALVLGKFTAALAAGVVGFSAAIARLGFDATVQKEAPDANQGRAFAEFETRFQLAWVLGAFVPVALPIPGGIGFLIVGVVALAGAGWYFAGMRIVRQQGRLPKPLTRRVAVALHQRRVSRTVRRTTTTDGPKPPSELPPPTPRAAGD